MLHNELIAICSEFHTKHANIPCERDIGLPLELFNVTSGVRLKNH
jgi:hypothetical protein